MPGTVAIVGAGQIGYAAAQAFARAGWRVEVRARHRPAWSVDGMDFRAYVKGTTIAPRADVVLDTIAFDAEDAGRYDPDRVGRIIVISSASVYRDAAGRTLDEAAANGFPDFPRPIAENQATVSPGPATYSTRKIAMEAATRGRFDDKAVILRPCAIHGAWTRHPREWWFVKRLLDGRTAIPLAYNGTNRFQTTSASMIAEAACAIAQMDVGGTFNVADEDSPTVAQIGHVIAAALGRACDFVPLPGDPLGSVGRTPWSIPAPMVLDTGAVRRSLSLEPGRYADRIPAAVAWLERQAPKNWRAAFPQLAAYPFDLFDYAAEDAAMAGQ